MVTVSASPTVGAKAPVSIESLLVLSSTKTSSLTIGIKSTFSSFSNTVVVLTSVILVSSFGVDVPPQPFK